MSRLLSPYTGAELTFRYSSLLEGNIYIYIIYIIIILIHFLDTLKTIDNEIEREDSETGTFRDIER